MTCLLLVLLLLEASSVAIGFRPGVNQHRLIQLLIPQSTWFDHRSIRRFSLNLSNGGPAASFPTEHSLLRAHVNLMVDFWRNVCLSSLLTDTDDVADNYFDLVLSKYYGDAGIIADKTARNKRRGRQLVDGLIKHIQFCKDTCAADGVFIMATQNEGNEDLLRLSRANFAMLTAEESRDEDWGHFDRELIDQYDDQAQEQLVFPEEEDDTVVLKDTKLWVQKGVAVPALPPPTFLR